MRLSPIAKLGLPKKKLWIMNPFEVAVLVGSQRASHA